MMTIAYWCVLIAIFLPYVFTSFAKFTGGEQLDNNSPREFLERQEGAQKRAHWAQLNTFEAVPAFSAAVIIAHLTQVTQTHIDYLAIGFVVSRLFYGVCYIKDWATLRSAVWAIGFLIIIALFVLGA